jgi:hypothetical protein
MLGALAGIKIVDVSNWIAGAHGSLKLRVDLGHIDCHGALPRSGASRDHGPPPCRVCILRPADLLSKVMDHLA